MSLPKYPEYSHGAIPSLGPLPAHWASQALKSVVARIESGVSVNAHDEPVSGQAFGVLKTSCVYAGRFDPAENKAVVEDELERVACPVKAGALIVSRMNTPSLVGAAGLVSTNAEHLFLPDRLWQVHFMGAEPAFVHYWTASPSYRAQVEMACAGTSASMQNLSQNEFLRFVLPVPPLEEQVAIATFLDRETAKIDALIAEQEKLIALLAEKRQATISHAVTRGLDPDATMKDSGVEWPKQVPQHWGQAKLQDLVAKTQHSFVNGPFGSDLLTSELTAEGVPVVYIRDVKEHGYERISEWCVTKEKAAQLKFCNVMPGDVLVAKVGDPPGVAAVYPSDEPSGVVTQDVIRLRLERSKADPGYLCWLLNSFYGRIAIDQISVESTRTRVGLGEYKQVRFSIPPLSEQEAISANLTEGIGRIRALSTDAELVIKLLQERRSALITAAVTGQIDVRGAVQPDHATHESIAA